MAQHAAIPALAREAAEIIDAPPIRTADEWADARRVLPAGNAEPGAWRSDRVPYTRPICQAFADLASRWVVVVMGSQMAKTETILNIIGHRFDDGPRVPCLYVGPTENQVRGFCRERLDPMLRTVPGIASKMAQGHEDKITEKYVAGVRLGGAWAGSATELASRPAGLVLLDERDRMESSTGGEGDPVELVDARIATFPGGKLGIFSTPTIHNASPIVALFDQGSREFWCWPCKHCGALFRPEARLLTYDKDAPAAALAESARVACPHCGGAHEDADKPALNAGGRFVAHRLVPGQDGVYEPVPQLERGEIRSFWVSGLCSPWQSFGRLAQKLAAAYASKDPEKLQAVLNTAFGETYRAAGDAPKTEDVRRTVARVPRRQVPSWAALLTMGVDVQKSGLWYAVRAFGFDQAAQAMRSHAIDHGFIFGDPEYDDVWLALSRVRDADYLTTDGNARRRVELALCDSGYNPGADRYRRPAHVVYEACRRSAWRMLPSKGHAAQKSPAYLSKIETLPSGRIIPGLRIWHVDTDHFKTAIHASIRRAAEDAAPLWTLHAEADEHYLEQLIAEELLITSAGRRIWKLRGRADNHLLDCEVLAHAAAWIHQAKTRPTTAPATRAPAPAVAPAPMRGPVGGGYVPRPGGRPWIPPRR
jgi:phage terminase large subunit GpA-like protein